MKTSTSSLNSSKNSRKWKDKPSNSKSTSIKSVSKRQSWWIKLSNVKDKFYYGKESISLKVKCRKPLIPTLVNQRFRSWKRNSTEWSSSTILWLRSKTKSPLKCLEPSIKRLILNWNTLPALRNKLPKRINLKLQINWKTLSRKQEKLRLKSWNLYNKLRKKSPWKKVNWNKSVRLLMIRPKDWEFCRTKTISLKLRKFWPKSEKTLMFSELQPFKRSIKSWKIYQTGLQSWCTKNPYWEKSSNKQEARTLIFTWRSNKSRKNMRNMLNFWIRF